MEMPQYTVNTIMQLLQVPEPGVRKLLIEAGIGVDANKIDPDEIIRYEDFRILWVSLANRREGRLLASLLIEESDNWFTKLSRRK